MAPRLPTILLFALTLSATPVRAQQAETDTDAETETETDSETETETETETDADTDTDTDAETDTDTVPADHVDEPHAGEGPEADGQREGSPPTASGSAWSSDTDSEAISVSEADAVSESESDTESDDDLDDDLDDFSDPDADDSDFWSKFAFGSYGRVVAASDLRGGTGRDADIVLYEPRLDEGTYLELELRREDQWEWMESKIVATLAIGGPVFHFDGNFDESLAIRNLYLELIDVAVDGLRLWAGSRMWRGDDMYLLDTWPLDNLNAVGGGLDYYHDLFQLRSVVAFARPDNPFQTQVVDVPPDDGSFTPDSIFILDRPRTVLALKGTYFPIGTTEDWGAKLTLYGELHMMGDGQRQMDDGTVEQLPADDGFMVGAQLGGWLVEGNAFANLFFRHARGLAAYDPLGVPFGTGTVITTERAEETMLALSANYEYDFVGVQVAAYYRRFRDADPSVLERNLLAEGAIDVRPHVWFTDWLGLAVDGSFQALEQTALDEITGDPVSGTVWKLGLLPFISPSGRGTYTRPHFRIIYAATFRDDGARRMYNSADPRASREVEHFLGIGAEWWIDTSSYLGPQLR